MLRGLSDRAAALTFVTLVLGVSLGTATVLDGLILAVSPLLVTLVMMLVVTREGWRRAGWSRRGTGRPGLRDWPFTLLATAGVSLLAAAGVVALGLASFRVPSGAWAGDLLALGITGPILAFAEEIGWRGYLLPRLTWLGEWPALLVSGVVWIAWHLPYILFTPYYHHDGNRALVLALFAGSVIVFSVLFGRLRLRTDSVWPSVLGHFAHNATFAWVATYLISTDNPVAANEYLAGDTGLFVLLGGAVFALVISRGRREPLR